MVEAAPATALEVAEPQLLLELLEVALDPPAQLGRGDELLDRGRLGQGREPVLARLLLAHGPLDQKPLLRPRLGPVGVAVRRANPNGGESRVQLARGALPPGDAPPRGCGQPHGQLLGRERPMSDVPAQPLWWSASARPGL